MTRTRQWMTRVIAVLGCAWALSAAWPALSLAQSDFERRVTELERLRPDARLSTIEARLDTLESVGKGILIAVAAQLILSGISFKRSR